MSKSKTVSGVVLAVLVAVVAWWVSHQGDAPPPLLSTAGAGRPTARSATPFKISRQVVASLVDANAPAKTGKVPPRVQSGQTGSGAAPDNESARRLRWAQAKTNAADVYNLIFDRLKTAGCKTKLDRIKELLGSKKYAALSWAEKDEIRTLLGAPEMREILALLQEAANKEQCDFKLDYAQGFALSLPHLGPLRDLIRLANLTGDMAAEAGDASQACSLIALGLKTSNNIGSDDLLISRLVRIAGDKQMLDSLGALAQCAQLSDDQAYALLLEIARRDYGAEMAAAVRKEEEMAVTVFDRLAAGEPLEAILGGLVGQSMASEEAQALLRQLKSEEYLRRNKAEYQEIINRYAELLALPYDATVQAKADQIQKDVVALPNTEFFLIKMSLPALAQIIKKAGQATAEVDAAFAEVASAVYSAKHGHPPASAADFKEVFDTAEAMAQQPTGK